MFGPLMMSTASNSSRRVMRDRDTAVCDSFARLRIYFVSSANIDRRLLGTRVAKMRRTKRLNEFDLAGSFHEWTFNSLAPGDAGC